MEGASIHPLGDRLKVLPLKPAEATQGGILMPEASEGRDRPLEGIVLAVGRGREFDNGRLVALECQIGDVVQFGKYAGIFVFDAAVGHDVILMREDEALGRKLERDITFVVHVGYARPHVPGDPRCERCRAGERVEAV